MRIILQKERGKPMQIRIPNCLLLNKFAASAAAKQLNKRGISLDCKQLLALAKQMQAARKRHPDWVLLEAEDGGGEKIKIIL